MTRGRVLARRPRRDRRVRRQVPVLPDSRRRGAPRARASRTRSRSTRGSRSGRTACYVDRRDRGAVPTRSCTRGDRPRRARGRRRQARRRGHRLVAADGDGVGRDRGRWARSTLALSADGATLVTRGAEPRVLGRGLRRASAGRSPNVRRPGGAQPRRPVAVAGGSGALLDAASRRADRRPGRRGTLAFSHDGARLAVGGDDGTVRVVRRRAPGATMAVLATPAPVTAIALVAEGDSW